MAACSTVRKEITAAERALKRVDRLLRGTGRYHPPKSLTSKVDAGYRAAEAARDAANAGSCARAAKKVREIRNAVNSVYTHTGP